MKTSLKLASLVVLAAVAACGSGRKSAAKKDAPAASARQDTAAAGAAPAAAPAGKTPATPGNDATVAQAGKATETSSSVEGDVLGAPKVVQQPSALHQGVCGNLTAWTAAASTETATRAVSIRLDLDALGIKHPTDADENFVPTLHELKVQNLKAGSVTLSELPYLKAGAFDDAFCSDIAPTPNDQISTYTVDSGVLRILVGKYAGGGRYEVTVKLEGATLIRGNDAVEELPALSIEADTGGAFQG